MMNKQQAAEYLGVSVRAVERYTQQGRLSVRYEPGRTRPVAVYREEELRPLKDEIAANLYHQRPAVEKANPANAEQSVDIGEVMALTRTGGNAEALALVLKSIAERLPAPGNSAPQTSVTDLAHKLTLSLAEAAQLSGLSRNHLREAISKRKLKAKIIGRGWRLKRFELEAYVKKL